MDHVQAVGAVDGVHQRVDLRPRARAQVVVIMVVMVIMVMVIELLIEVMSMVMVVVVMVVVMVGIISRVIAVVEHHSPGRLEKQMETKNQNSD